MREHETVVIVGAGLAGHSAAESLRSEGFNGKIVLFGQELQRPYDRPPLSKEFLKGEWQGERLYYRPESAYCEQRIDLRLNTRVDGLDTEKQLVLLAEAEPVRYDHLLLAVGGYPKRLTPPRAGCLPGDPGLGWHWPTLSAFIRGQLTPSVKPYRSRSDTSRRI